MKTSEVLTRARELLAGGWHEPFSVAADGTLRDRDHEDAVRFCTRDAIALAARVDGAADDAAELELNRALRAAGHAWSFCVWVALPDRTHNDVLQLFAKAIAHSLAEESRHV